MAASVLLLPFDGAVPPAEPTRSSGFLPIMNTGGRATGIQHRQRRSCEQHGVAHTTGVPGGRDVAFAGGHRRLHVSHDGAHLRHARRWRRWLRGGAGSTVFRVRPPLSQFSFGALARARSGPPPWFRGCGERLPEAHRWHRGSRSHYVSSAECGGRSGTGPRRLPAQPGGKRPAFALARYLVTSQGPAGLRAASRWTGGRRRRARRDRCGPAGRNALPG